MTAKHNFQVTLWEHSQFVTVVRAKSEHEAMAIAQFRYGAASRPTCEGFALVDTYNTDWDIARRSGRSHKRRSP